MSRIDEAMRRAATATVSSEMPAMSPSVEWRAHPVDVSSLDRYPIELAPRPKAPSSGGASIAPKPRANQPAPIDSLSEHERLVVSTRMPRVSVEQYRRLAASLHELQKQRGLKTLMVSSAVPREGKTLTITNLALTLSESFQQRVLLIDADLRRPSIHEVLDIPNRRGLGDVILSNSDALPLVEISQNLSVLTAGHLDGDPMARLSSDRASALVRRVAEQFDWVLLDAPPVGLLPDAQLIARLSEAILFVVAAGSTPYHLVQHAIEELGAERIVGTVLNRVEASTLALDDYYQGYCQSEGARQ
jgi:capsular exopolysaccharide synthesis family protein